MLPCWAWAVLSLLPLTAALPAQQQPPAADQPSPADQLSAILTPVVERAVSRSQGSWQLSQLAGQLARQQVRLDTVVHDVAALQLAALAGGGKGGTDVPSGVCPSPQPEPEKEQESEPEPEQEPKAKPETKTEPESGPTCENQLTPLTVDAAPHQEPERRACARSCLQLRDQGGSPQDGVYWLAGLPVPALCDFSHDGGGWTLLLTAVSQQGWDPLSVLGRNESSPSFTDNYSILRHADAIRDLGNGSRFAYRIEAQAEKGRQRWGGVWLAPRRYSFVDETASQTEVSRVRWFDTWGYKNNGIKKRMPWINTGLHGTAPVLTTTAPTADNWWGTMVAHESATTYHHSPWIHPEAPESGTVLYWMREEAV